jgi:hypothetical protein
VFIGLFFLVLDPFTLGVCNFFISNLFSTIANVSDAPKEGVQVLFEDQKQQASPWIQPALNT